VHACSKNTELLLSSLLLLPTTATVAIFVSLTCWGGVWRFLCGNITVGETVEYRKYVLFVGSVPVLHYHELVENNSK
jgi:hypothetical protein